MEKSSKIICLGILLFFFTFIIPLIPVLKNFTTVALFASPIIVAYGIYSKGQDSGKSIKKLSGTDFGIGPVLFVDYYHDFGGKRTAYSLHAVNNIYNIVNICLFIFIWYFFIYQKP